ncbi:MmgE/PrpD family protein [Sulfitobacter sp. KE29]|uniref:MmgE/PrpD family protein n=1 Tax=Sulfitobacter TaxID=60136 RepID=UPI0023E2D918|nr:MULTISPECIES: MmgE/PrpD family protein [Sulfitobacter]MDF3420135.1 MmgE/PrpD family protein [Sulfitobacter sp. Ks38]MDF3427620.1 MmgE/PrpD family protein [Sulfitobacter sp. KE29]MDF3431199.1 MmgE/PrpD family protein [Sulfitobacter sp. S46]MDF3445972.1 MmgE/PrpD family protein [Sulfitobacter sp. KE31]MDF3549981.1 MmgE/PrpD family protein [Sulfitobacter sp. KE28]
MSGLNALLDLAELPDAQIPQTTLNTARLSLMDWLMCGRAGVDEPVSEILRSMADHEGGAPQSAIFGGGRAPARMAALINGATSHALDYDDTHFAHVGHLSVGIYPAALAVGEAGNLSAEAVCAAFAIGGEAAIRVGLALGRAHYERGFHQTATAGAFGATVAAGRLMGLTRTQMRTAIGLCATRATGLRCQFGTMGKPYNAGIAAAAGVECAQLAKAGITAPDDGLFGQNGYLATHSDAPGDIAMVHDVWLLDEMKYKLHACCHGTHAMIEALKGHDIGSVRALHLRTNPRWLTVCDIKTPRSGLEVKFSYAWLAGMALRGDSTGSDRAYTTSLANDPDLATFAQCVKVSGDSALTDMQAAGEIQMQNGSIQAFAYDMATPIPISDLTISLRSKARALLGPTGDELCDALASLDGKMAHGLAAYLEHRA